MIMLELMRDRYWKIYISSFKYRINNTKVIQTKRFVLIFRTKNSEQNSGSMNWSFIDITLNNVNIYRNIQELSIKGQSIVSKFCSEFLWGELFCPKYFNRQRYSIYWLDTQKNWIPSWIEFIKFIKTTLELLFCFQKLYLLKLILWYVTGFFLWKYD